MGSAALPDFARVALSRPAVASVIVGAETVDEITANASAADVVLENAQLDALTALSIDTSS